MPLLCSEPLSESAMLGRAWLLVWQESGLSVLPLLQYSSLLSLHGALFVSTAVSWLSSQPPMTWAQTTYLPTAAALAPGPESGALWVPQRNSRVTRTPLITFYYEPQVLRNLAFPIHRPYEGATVEWGSRKRKWDARMMERPALPLQLWKLKILRVGNRAS